MRPHQLLFSQDPLANYVHTAIEKAGNEIDGITRDHFLATPDDDLVNHVASRYAIDPLVIYEDRMTQRQDEMKVDIGLRGQPYYVAGIRITVSIPFTGLPHLWALQPGRMIPGSLPCGNVVSGNANPGTLQFVIDHPLQGEMGQTKQSLERNLHLLRQYVEFQKSEVDGFNNSLAHRLRERIKARRERLAKRDQLVKLIEIPMAPNPNAPTFKPLQVQKRIIAPLPAPPEGGYKAELGIEEKVYEDILSIIRHVGRTFEATPKTFVVHGEEGLRDIMLANLNGHYRGLATGETFRGAGKTDIRIEAENRAAFIAECKVWKGQKTITESLDQLLGYLTWRDCKTSIILFNKDVAGFTELLAKVQSAVEGHLRYMKTASTSGQGEWRFVIRSKDDDARLIHVHVFLLNIFLR